MASLPSIAVTACGELSGVALRINSRHRAGHIGRDSAKLVGLLAPGFGL